MKDKREIERREEEKRRKKKGRARPEAAGEKHGDLRRSE
jgi:hypothetical protein